MVQDYEGQITHGSKIAVVTVKGLIRRQWEDIRGNAKWEVIKVLGALLIPIAYSALQKIRTLPVDRYVFGVLFVVSLAVFLYLGRSPRRIVPPPHSPDTQSPLSQRTFSLCRKLRDFLAEHGPEPNVDSIWHSNISKEEYTEQYARKIQPWETKFSAGWWRKFEQPVVDIRHEFAEENIVDPELEKAMGDMQAEPNEKALRRIVDRLSALAGQLEGGRQQIQSRSKNVEVRDWVGEWTASEKDFQDLAESDVFAELFNENWTIRSDTNPHARTQVDAACELAGSRLFNSPGILLSEKVKNCSGHQAGWLWFLKETYGLNRPLPGGSAGYIERLARVSAPACKKCAAQAFD